jgi:phage terminase large subunit
MVPKFIRADGISATRLELRRMWFNADRCAHGIEALRQYRTAYDEKLKEKHARCCGLCSFEAGLG